MKNYKNKATGTIVKAVKITEQTPKDLPQAKMLVDVKTNRAIFITNDGVEVAHMGDYLISDPTGLYSCEPDIFELTYEESN